MDLFFIITTLMSMFMGEQSSQQSMEQFNAEQLEQQQSNITNQISQNQANITGYEQELYDEDSPLNFIGGLYNKLTGKIKTLKQEDKQLSQQNSSSSSTQSITPEQAQVLYNMTHQNQCFALRLHHRRLLGSKNEPKRYSEAETKQWEEHMKNMLEMANKLRREKWKNMNVKNTTENKKEKKKEEKINIPKANQEKRKIFMMK